MMTLSMTWLARPGVAAWIAQIRGGWGRDWVHPGFGRAASPQNQPPHRNTRTVGPQHLSALLGKVQHVLIRLGPVSQSAGCRFKSYAAHVCRGSVFGPGLCSSCGRPGGFAARSLSPQPLQQWGRGQRAALINAWMALLVGTLPESMTSSSMTRAGVRITP